MTSLSNILSPLDTCHGDSKEPSSTKPKGADQRSNRPGTLDTLHPRPFFLVLAVFLVLIGMSLLDGPYSPRVDEFYNGQVVR